MSFFAPESELGLVYHIGTASVGAGLVKFCKGKVPRVLSTLREHMPYRENVSVEVFQSDMIAALVALNARLVKEAHTVHVKHVFYIFSTPWAMAETKIIILKEEKPFTLSKSQVDRIVATHEKMFETEMAGEGKPDSLKAIERRVIDIKLNGYQLADPYGKLAKTADISFFTSIVPRTIFDKVIDISHRTYHPRDTRSFSFSLASFSVIRDVFHEESDFIFLNIGGELSDITIVQNGLILETASFPLGRHFIIRKIQSAFKASLSEAVSLANLFEEGKAEQSIKEKLQPIMDQAADEWTAALHSVLGRAGGRISLPTRLFVVVNNDFTSYFMRTLESERVSEFGVTDAPLTVTLVNHENLKPAVEFADGSSKDPFVTMCAAFAGRVYESKDR
jgi:hypothetical protein